MRSRVTAFLAATLTLTALAVAPAALAGGGCHPSGDTRPVASTGSSLTVRIDGCIFLPAIDRVPVGARVTFANTSQGVHDVSGADYAWHSPTLDPGDTFAYTFTEPGLYPYSCSLHPGMAGVIEVTGAAAAAAASGVPVVAKEAPVRDTSELGSTGIVGLAAGGLGLFVGGTIAIFVLRRRYPLG